MHKAAYSNSGFAYIGRGLELIRTKGLRRYVVVPILTNLILFGLAFFWLYGEVDYWLNRFMGWLPEFFQWLEFILWPLAIITIIALFSFIFSTIMNVIAAPFNGLLAEKVERYESGESLGDEGFLSLFKDIPRTLKREMQKLMYYIPRALGFFLLSLIIPVIGQVLWYVFVCWMMSIQYLDYPFDNHKVSFPRMRSALNGQRGKTLGFGFGVTVLTMIPLINLIIMPLAVCGATSLWVDHYRRSALN
ncbi:sulfate transporter CysZ [Idiomarina aminovorans]|uniref:sulfate transporter CysZ n=1 Tax=Idiomarina aminovorans TaxID=2914829 RepID=UPI0020030086|nr:sulfate transporter CysZ [Idiomarina sp. ATCH4]MCK7459970.1 sulfate transporter CysZ [Idiomarina sp. ATCH4]